MIVVYCRFCICVNTDLPPQPKTVLGIGAATWDRFMVVPDFPTGEGVTQALASAEQGGGPVATALCALSALGHPTVLLDSQSDDATGQMIQADLARFGVGVSHLRIHPGGRSAHAHILVRKADGARHIHYFPASGPELSAEDIAPGLLSNASLLHLNGRHESACRQAVKQANELGVPVSFDGGAGRWRESLRDLVLASQIRIVAKDFALKFATTDSLEAAATALLADFPALLVITDGTRGSWIWSQAGEHFHQPAFPASPVVDTTGCGDIFHGALLHGWLQRWPLRKTAEFASKLAAETAKGLGGRSALLQPGLLNTLVHAE